MINKKLVETPVKMMNRMEEITDLICEYNDEVQKQQEENKRLHSIIKEVRELVENGTDFKSIYFKKDKEDLWKVILANEIKEKYLDILDKGE